MPLLHEQQLVGIARSAGDAIMQELAKGAALEVEKQTAAE